MPQTYEELKGKKVAELRQIAEGIDHEAVRGFSTMHKEQLVVALCAALGIEAQVHHEVVGVNKNRIKARIRELKTERDEALASGDREAYRRAIRQIHRHKRRLRRAMV